MWTPIIANEKRRLIGLSVREPGAAAPDLDEAHYHALLANAADYMVDRLGRQSRLRAD